MCSKDLDEQYTPDIAFLFCTALFFILMYLLQTHIFLPCVVFKTKMSFAVFNCHIILIENLCRVLCKVEAHSSDIIFGSREGKCSLMMNIHHE